MISILPDFGSVSQVADWLELSILYDERAISKAKIISLFSDNNKHDQEQTIDSALSELERRQAMMGNSPPFCIENNAIKRSTYTWEDIPEYVMCLIFSLQGVKKIKEDDDGTKLFERVSKDAVKFYLGGEAIVLGFPSEDRLNQQLKELAALTNEKKSEARSPLSTDKDKGVDIIAWKSHKDGRSNQIVLLIQAAAGYHWNLKKPISEIAWSEFMFWSAKFVRGIIIATTLDEIKFVKARDDYNMIFDRVRIYRALMYEGTRDTSLSEEVKVWCQKELN